MERWFWGVTLHCHYSLIKIVQSAGAVEYTDCISTEVKTPPTGFLDMQLNNLMVRFQLSWIFGGMWSTPSLPLFPGPLCPGVIVLDKVRSMGQKELNYVFMLNSVV